MAIFSTCIRTNERLSDKTPDSGHWDVRITAGLNENPVEVMKEALRRVQAAVDAIPSDKRFPRFPHSLDVTPEN